MRLIPVLKLFRIFFLKMISHVQYQHPQTIGTQLYVYELPSLKTIFELPLYDFDRHDCPYIGFSSCVTFSPDSSYFLINTIQTCISIKNQSIVPFIPHGPAAILSSSFSSCRTKLVSAEEQTIKLWDVIKKELLAESSRDFGLYRPITCFSGCNSSIFLFESRNYNDQLNIFHSTTLTILKTTRTDICSVKDDNCIQFFSSPYSMVEPDKLEFECWQLTTGERILCTRSTCQFHAVKYVIHLSFYWRFKQLLKIARAVHLFFKSMNLEFTRCCFSE